MKTLEIVGYKRNTTGKKTSKALRKEGHVPCVIYGKENIPVYIPAALFKPLVYTPEVYFISLNIEGSIHSCILYDIQYHPVSEIIMHADFLVLSDKKKIKMHIPIKLEGRAKGVAKGGELYKKYRSLPILAYAKDMPEYICLNIESLEMGAMKKVKDIVTDNFDVLMPAHTSIVSVEVPRALRSKNQEEEKEDKK